jgi:hypothetical protein
MNDLSLEKAKQEQLSLRQVTGPKYPAGHLTDLSEKYDATLGDASPGIASVQTAISTNNQGRLQELMRQKKDVELADARNTIIQDIANQTGGSPTPEDISVVQGLSEEQIYSENINSILEEEYSRKVTNTQLDRVNAKTGEYDAAIVNDPVTTALAIDRAEWITSRNLISNNIYQDIQHKFNNAGIVQQGLAWAQGFIPFRSWQQMNNFTQRPPFLNDWLPGDSIEEQVAWLHTLPPAEFKAKLEEGVNSAIAWGNYLDAMHFVEATLSYGDSSQMWENVMAGLDVATTVPVGGLIKALKGSSRAVNTALKDVEAVASVTGHGDDAARASIGTALAENKLSPTNIAKISDVEKNFSSISRPAEAFVGKPMKASSAVVARLTAAAQLRGSRAMQVLTDINRVERLAPTEVDAAVQATVEDMNRIFTDQNHHIINFVRNDAENSAANQYSVTMLMGMKDGKLFPSMDSARMFAGKYIKLKTGDYEIVGEGTGYAVAVTRNVDETRAGIRDFTVETDSKNADNFFSRFMSGLMGADTKLSKDQTRARGVVIMSQERVNDLLSEFGKPMAALQKNKKGFKEFEQFIVKTRDHVDPDRGRGLTFHTMGEFEDAWMDMFGKLPTYEQMDAYDSFKQFYDLDWVSRALDVYKQKAVLGIEQFTARRSIGKTGYDTMTLEGKEIASLPRGSKDRWNAVLLDENGVVQKGNRFDSRYMKDDAWANIQAKLDEGYVIVQPYDGYALLDDEPYNFILMKSFTRDRVPMNLSYKQGSRVIQKHPYYIKQPKIRNSEGFVRYLGDMSFANARDAVEGKFILDKLNEARQKIIRGDADIQQFWSTNFPMWEYKDFIKHMYAAGGDMKTPFSLVRSGARTIDTEDVAGKLRAEGQIVNTFETNDAWRLSNQVHGKFLGERDETNMKAWGVEKDSIFELSTDNQIDPLETMRLSMGNMVDVNVVNDYKIKSIRDYTQQFGSILNGTKYEFDTNGLHFIYEPKYRPGADPNQIKAAEAVRKSILSLWNHSTIIDKQLGAYKEKIVRTVRGKFGDNVADFVNDKALPTIQHTDAYMRAFAFHTKMGFFNIKQLFLQSTSAVNIMSITPKYGSKAAMLAMPIQAGLHAPEKVLGGIGAKLAKTMGIEPNDYVELITMFKKSGFNLVSNDIAYLDDLRPPALVKGKISKVLDVGTMFFKTGERNARSMAFAAAYLERKAVKKVLNRADEAWILQRAKDLTGNMTRDSSAPYQRGYPAIATQFFGYQMRLMEQMLGSKLTKAEKARLFTGMSMMYGVPVGMAMTFGVVPIRDFIKDWMVANDVDTNNNPLMDTFVDGFASQILEAISGTDFNVSERYGPGGITTFYDLWKGDASFSEILMGASGGIIGDTFKDLDPILRWFTASIDMNDNTAFPITVEDIINPLRNISTVNNAIKLDQAIQLGKYISRNENVLTGNITPIEAWIGAVLGLDPERVSDAFRGIAAIDGIKANKADARKSMIADYRRFIQALRGGNNDEAAKYIARVKGRSASAGLTLEEYNNIIRQAIDEEPLDETVLKQLSEYRKK